MAMEVTSDAAAPQFFKDNYGDFFMMSSDKVLFQVSRSHLAFASETFASMFSITTPEAHSDGKKEQPLHMAEPSQILDAIFRLIYGTGETSLANNPQLFLGCFQFARKFAMDHVISSMKVLLVYFIPSHPVEAFIVADVMKWQNERRDGMSDCAELDIPSMIYTREPDILFHASCMKLLKGWITLQQNSRDAILDFLNGKPMVDLRANPTAFGQRRGDKALWYGKEPCDCSGERQHPIALPKENNQERPLYFSPVSPPFWVKKLSQTLFDKLRTCARVPIKAFDAALKEAPTECASCAKNMANENSRISIERLKRGVCTIKA